MSADAADLFCEVFDTFEADTLDPHEANEWLTDQQVREIASDAEGQVLATGTLDEERLWESIEDAFEPDKRRFAYLTGIDNALLHAHPHTASHDTAGLTAIATRYAETGRFNTDAVTGALLPRFAFPAEDDDLAMEKPADAMTAVVRVPADAWSKTAHLVIPARSDFNRRSREQGVTFGCVPFIETLDELGWETDVDGNGTYFRSSMIPGDAARERIDPVLAALDGSGAAVGVMPEISLTDELLDRWLEAVRETPPARDGRLRWLFLGTGPLGGAKPPRNRGVLIDRLTAETLLVQDKVFPFVLDAGQIEDWRLGPYLGDDVERAREDITRGTMRTIAESNLGRIAVLICEDLARTMTVGPSLLEHGLSLAICPIFSGPTEPHHWEHAKAKEYAAQIGTQVLVANSRAVGRAQGLEEIGTALAHSPFDTDIVSTSSCEEVALLHLSDDGAIRLVKDSSIG